MKKFSMFTKEELRDIREREVTFMWRHFWFHFICFFYWLAKFDLREANWAFDTLFTFNTGLFSLKSLSYV